MSQAFQYAQSSAVKVLPPHSHQAISLIQSAILSMQMTFSFILSTSDNDIPKVLDMPGTLRLAPVFLGDTQSPSTVHQIWGALLRYELFEWYYGQRKAAKLSRENAKFSERLRTLS